MGGAKWSRSKKFVHGMLDAVTTTILYMVVVVAVVVVVAAIGRVLVPQQIFRCVFFFSAGRQFCAVTLT